MINSFKKWLLPLLIALVLVHSPAFAASPHFDDGYVADPNATAQQKEKARKEYELQGDSVNRLKQSDSAVSVVLEMLDGAGW